MADYTGIEVVTTSPTTYEYLTEIDEPQATVYGFFDEVQGLGGDFVVVSEAPLSIPTSVISESSTSFTFRVSSTVALATTNVRVFVDGALVWTGSSFVGSWGLSSWQRISSTEYLLSLKRSTSWTSGEHNIQVTFV